VFLQYSSLTAGAWVATLHGKTLKRQRQNRSDRRSSRQPALLPVVFRLAEFGKSWIEETSDCMHQDTKESFLMRTYVKPLGYTVPLLLAAALLTTPARADTQWDGTITTDVTWTKSGSPHRVNGITISSGVTVTVEADAIVIFSAGMTVNGRMLAQGTTEAPIVMGGLDYSSAPGIHLSFASSTASEFRFCHFSNINDISVGRTTPQANHLFQHCTFRQFSGCCMTLRSAPARVLNCIFSKCPNYSVQIVCEYPSWSDEDVPTLFYDVFDQDALSITGSYQYIDLNNRVFFRYNRAARGRGIQVGTAGYYGYLRNVLISDCDLSGCDSSLVVSVSSGTSITGLTVTNCDLKNVEGTLPENLDLRGNYWGVNDFSVINSRVFGGGADSAALQPFSSTSHFPQADVDNSDSGNATRQADADLVKKYLVGLVNLTPTQLDIADVDRDGKVDIRDALMIESYVKGLIWKLPAR
jgi:hypothetical protein